MKVLITGSAGRIGSYCVEAIQTAGHEVVQFDAARGDDIRNIEAVYQAATQCHAIAHLAAIANDGVDTPEVIFDVNVRGTWNVLRAAEHHGIGRVIAFSSIQALGIVHAGPVYLPINDDHPRRVQTPYELSKQINEDTCEAFTTRCGITTVCMRPTAVLPPEMREVYPGAGPYTREHYAALASWVDVRDVAAAVVCALHAPTHGHVRLLLAADDSCLEMDPREIAATYFPEATWRGATSLADPHGTLVDASRAKEVLGWRPEHRWR